MVVCVWLRLGRFGAGGSGRQVGRVGSGRRAGRSASLQCSKLGECYNVFICQLYDCVQCSNLNFSSYLVFWFLVSLLLFHLVFHNSTTSFINSCLVASVELILV